MKFCIAIAAVAAAIQVAASDEAPARSFNCTGQVAFVCGGSPQRFAILGERGGNSYSLSHATFWIPEEGTWRFRSGDIVNVSGTSEVPDGRIKDELPDERANIVTNLVVLGRHPFPSGENARAGHINDGGAVSQCIRITGIASSIMRDEMNEQWNWFVLRTGNGDVYVAVPDNEHRFERLRALTDAEIEVKGIVLTQNRWRRFTGHYLLPLGEDGIVLLHPRPAISSAPNLSASDFGADIGYIRKRNKKFIHRVKATGTLVASSRRMCFIETPDGKLIKAVPMDESPRPKCGTSVVVAGFASMGMDGLQLSDASLEPSAEIASESIAEPAETDIATLFRLARNPGIYAPSTLRRRTAVTGVVASSAESIKADRTIRIEQNGQFVTVDISGICDPLNVLMGAAIRVTGVCHAEFESDPSIATFPRFVGFSIIPMSADDIAVVKSPPWWTTGRLAALVLSLLGALAVVSGLAIALKAMSDRRGRLLYDERVAHVRTEAKVEERTRLAVELHDAISQTLTGVALQIDSAARANEGGSGRVAAFLKTSQRLVAACRRELQDCLWDLRTRTFEEKDMTEAIQRAIGPQTEGIDALVRFNVPRAKLSESTTHSILCIVRELTANAVRHGRATRIRIAGEYREGRITFSVRDNGCGFDAAAAPGPREGHFGIQGVRERISTHKGTMEISTAPGGGTKVTVSMTQGQ